MRIRICLGLLSIAALVAAEPAAHAARSRAAPQKIVAPRAGAGKPGVLGRVRARLNGFKRKPTKAAAAARQGGAMVRPARPSIAHNVGWGAFFATLGTASAMRGGVLGAIVGGAAAAYNGVKAWLVARRGASVDQAGAIAFNAGWGTFWGGIGAHGLATGNPLAAAIGLGAGAYNIYKAASNTRALPGRGE